MYGRYIYIYNYQQNAKVKKLLNFCKADLPRHKRTRQDAIDYDAAVPTNNATAALNKIVLSQDSPVALQETILHLVCLSKVLRPPCSSTTSAA